MRPRAGQPLSHDSTRERGLAPVLIVAAVLALVAAAVAVWIVAVRARHRRAAPPPEPTTAVALLEPRGDIAVTPRAFRWTPVPSAASYKVTIADDDAVWPMFVRTTTESSLPLDAKDAAAISAGRIHMWEVIALDAAGSTVAQGKARFRVRLPGEGAGSEPIY